MVFIASYQKILGSTYFTNI